MTWRFVAPIEREEGHAAMPPPRSLAGVGLVTTGKPREGVADGSSSSLFVWGTSVRVSEDNKRCVGYCLGLLNEQLGRLNIISPLCFHNN